MLQYTTLQYTRIHYTNYTTPQLQLQLHLQLQLQYATLHPAVVVRWPLQPLQPLQKTQLQPPFGPSVDSLCHAWVTTTNLSYRFSICETSATALCGTTGIPSVSPNSIWFIPFVATSLQSRLPPGHLYIFTQAYAWGKSSNRGSAKPAELGKTKKARHLEDEPRTATG